MCMNQQMAWEIFDSTIGLVALETSLLKKQNWIFIPSDCSFMALIYYMIPKLWSLPI